MNTNNCRQIIISPLVYRVEMMRQEWVEGMGLCVDPYPDRRIINGWLMHHLPKQVEHLATLRFFEGLGIDIKDR